MNYIQITENFLNEYPDYKHDVLNFNDYLKTQWKNSLSDDTIRFLLQGLNVDFLLSSLIYNVEERKKYKSKTTAKRYATVIGQFFNYIRKKTDIENPGLYDAISYNRLRENTYMKRMMAYIDGCNLLEGIVEMEALSQRDVLRILEWADTQLEKEDIWYADSDGTQVNPTGLKRAMAALGVKMMLVYGITYRELRKFKAGQYDSQRNSIRVNGVELRLPIRLAIQMRRMAGFLNKNGIKNEEDLFFIDSTGQAWGEITSSSGIPDYLGPLIGSTSITSVVKYGISQLIKVGVNDTIIKQITGASDKLIKGCLMQEDEDVMRIVNDKLVTVELYYQF